MTTRRSGPDRSDPRLELALRNRTANVFVTQPRDRPEEEHVTLIPVVTELPWRLLDAGLNTLQRTALLQKRTEAAELTRLLVLKRREFQSRAQCLAQRRSDVELRQRQNEERVTKFQKFVSENDVKKLQALNKFKEAREQNDIKQKSVERLTQRLALLQYKKHVLKDRINKYKIYEDYLQKTISFLPASDLESDSDSLVLFILRRHETLSVTRLELLRRLETMEQEVEQHQHRLQSLRQEHDVATLKVNRELSELQVELESLQDVNKQDEASLLQEQDQSREKVEEVGNILLSIQNLAERCFLPSYGALENMDVLCMMDMVKEYFLDKADTERRGRSLVVTVRNAVKVMKSPSEVKRSDSIRKERVESI